MPDVPHQPDSAVRLINETLSRVRAGDPRASSQLLPLLYSELRGLARSLLARRKPGQTLQPTALVHEAYLRVAGDDDHTWDGRGHFFASAARAMRDILVEEARRKAAIKRGGGRERVELDEQALAIEPPVEDMLALNEALTELERADPRKGQVVMLRYFAGLSLEETAASLGVSIATVDREWRFARAWLLRKLDIHGDEEPLNRGDAPHAG